MRISGLAIDPVSKMPFVILENQEKKKSLPIWIGFFEASAIVTQLEGVKLSRPMTHDLMKNLTQTLKAKLLRIEIVDLRDNTYFAELVLVNEKGEEKRIDARPSDAIAFSLRMQAPVFVADQVLEKSGASQKKPKAGQPISTDTQSWEDVLKNLSPEAFGKYKM